MTTGGSGDDNESILQEDAPFQQQMERTGARVPPECMGNVKNLTTVSQSTPGWGDLTNYEVVLEILPNPSVVSFAANDYVWGTIYIVNGGITQSVAGNM